jgi:hypothetical protein
VTVIKKLASAVGRFCKRAGLRDEIFYAALSYSKLVAKYRLAVRAPRNIPRSGALELGSPTTGELADIPIDEYIDLCRRIVKIDHKIRDEAGPEALRLMRKLVIDQDDNFANLAANEAPVEPLVAGLVALARELGFIRQSAHPFQSDAIAAQ